MSHCKKCSQALLSDAVFCMYCGHNQNEPVRPARPPAEAVQTANTYQPRSATPRTAAIPRAADMPRPTRSEHAPQKPAKKSGAGKTPVLIVCILAILVVGGGAFWFLSRTHALVGTWYCENRGNYEWTFNADGTGSRGPLGHQLNFAWEAEGDTVTINFISGPGSMGMQQEQWTYQISGDTLIVTSQLFGETIRYLRGEGREGDDEPDSAPPDMETPDTETPDTETPDGNVANPLVGVWQSTEFEDFIYVFNADGSGTMIDGEAFDFSWTSEHGVVRIFPYGEGGEFVFSYFIIDASLFLQDSGSERVFFRIG